MQVATMGLWETAKILGQSMQFDGNIMDSTKYYTKQESQGDDGYETCIDTVPLPSLPLPSIGLLPGAGTHGHLHSHHLSHLIDSNGNSSNSSSGLNSNSNNGRMMLGGGPGGGGGGTLEQMTNLRQSMGMDGLDHHHFGLHNHNNHHHNQQQHQLQQQQQQHNHSIHNHNHNHSNNNNNNNMSNNHRSPNSLPSMKQLNDPYGDPYNFVDEPPNNICLSNSINNNNNNNSSSNSSMNSQQPPQAKKRGRRKKPDLNVKMDDYGIIGNRTNSTNNNSGSMRDNEVSKKDRKLHDRFNGLSEEEVSQRTVPDHLAPNLDLIWIGINPGLFAAYKQHHYSGPGNHFWKCLYLSGLVPEPLTAEDDSLLLRHGIGFTNMVARPTKGSADLTRREIKQGSQILREKLQKYQPKIACFNGKLIYEVFSGKKDFHFGKQPECVEGTNTCIWVMPSSSARCAQLPRAADKGGMDFPLDPVPFYTALKKFRDYLNGLIPELDESEVVFPESGKSSKNNGELKLMDPSSCSSPQLGDDSELGFPDVIVPSKKKRGRPRKGMEKQSGGGAGGPVAGPPAPVKKIDKMQARKESMLLMEKLEKEGAVNGFDPLVMSMSSGLKRANSNSNNSVGVGSIVSANNNNNNNKPLETGRKRRGRPKKAKLDDLPAGSPPLPPFSNHSGGSNTNTPDMLRENSNNTPTIINNNITISGTCLTTTQCPTASSVSSGYSTAASSTGGEGELRGERESTSSGSGGGRSSGRMRMGDENGGSGGPSPSHHDSYTTQSDLSSEISAAISCGSAPPSPHPNNNNNNNGNNHHNSNGPNNINNDNVFDVLGGIGSMDQHQQLPPFQPHHPQQQQQLHHHSQHNHNSHLLQNSSGGGGSSKTPHNISSLSTSSLSNSISSSKQSPMSNSHLLFSPNNNNSNSSSSPGGTSIPNPNSMSMSMPGSLYGMNMMDPSNQQQQQLQQQQQQLLQQQQQDPSSYMSSYHHHLQSYNDSRLRASSSSGTSSQLYQASSNIRDPSTELPNMQQPPSNSNNSSVPGNNNPSNNSSFQSSSTSSSSNNTNNPNFEGTPKSFDVASKSLSGLESLVDQIPSIGEADILSHHHPHHGMMSGPGPGVGGSGGLIPDALSHSQSLSSVASAAAALSHHHHQGISGHYNVDGQSGFLPYGGSPVMPPSYANSASHYASSAPYYASDLSSTFPYCSPPPPPSSAGMLFGFSNYGQSVYAGAGGYSHHPHHPSSLHHSPYGSSSVPGYPPVSSYSGPNPYQHTVSSASAAAAASSSVSSSAAAQRFPQRLHLRQDGMDHMGFGGGF